MAARAAAFSDPEVGALLQSRFVPVAENCSHLQRQPDAEGELFRRIAEQGHYAGREQPTDTRQGMYACTSDGTLLASCNVHGADRLLPVLRQALERWAALGPAAGGAGAPAGAEPGSARYHPHPPEGGLVLRVWARDLPREAASGADAGGPPPADWRQRAFNLDHAWLRAEEAAALVPPPGYPGAFPWPDGLARRVARYHLVDNVRGETPMWRPEDVECARLQTTVRRVAGTRLELSLEGEARLAREMHWVGDFSGRAHGGMHRIEVQLEGAATWSTAEARFERFCLLGLGRRWGGTPYNSRGDDPGPAPIGYVLELVEPDARLVGDATPPQGIWADYFGGR